MKKLSLKRETLRNLQDDELRTVAGGYALPQAPQHLHAERRQITGTAYTCPVPSTSSTCPSGSGVSELGGIPGGGIGGMGIPG